MLMKKSSVMCLQEMYLKRPSLCAWWRRGGLGFLLSRELIPGNAQGKRGGFMESFSNADGQAQL